AKRTTNPQNIRPKTTGPVTPPCMTGTSKARSARSTSATTTGSPATSAVKIVRRDQSMRPSDRSKTRIDAASTPVPAGPAPGRGAACSTSAPHQVLEHGLQVVVGRRQFLDRAARPACRQLGQPLVERVGRRRLDDERVGLEAQTDDAGMRQELAAEASRIGRPDVDRVRMFVDQVADAMDVA